jgi:putative transposase
MLTGLSRSTWHYRSKPRTPVTDPVPQKDRAYPSRISARDRTVIADKIGAGWLAGHSVDHSFACCWDDGVMVASRRSWWRIASTIADQSARPAGLKRPGNTAPRSAPVLKATGPGQVWSWDITDLRTPWRGVAFKAYSIIDIYSRMLVGWRVEERECDDLAVAMFEDAFADHGLPEAVHADSGPAMRSTLLKDLLFDLGVGQTHNRPRVSNDNPFSESEFRTMKYRPNYPGTFTAVDAARAWSAPTCPATTSNTATAASHCSPPQKSTAGHGCRAGNNATKRNRPTTTPTPNGSEAARIPQLPAPSSESTSPTKPNPTDSTHLDNDRVCSFGRSYSGSNHSAAIGGSTITADAERPCHGSSVASTAP